MAKQGGMGQHFYLDGYDLSGDVGSADNIETNISSTDMTGIDKFAHERQSALKDGALSFTAFFNPASSQAHPVLKTRPTTDRVGMYTMGNVIGNECALIVGKQVNYGGARGEDASLKFKVDMTANGYGLEWGAQLTAGKRTDAAATAGSPYDFGAATSFGFQAYLQVFSFAGTDVTVKLQDCATVGGSYTDITSGAFAQVTSGPQAQRIAVGGTATVREFVKVTTVTSGGFSSLVFAVALVKNAVAVAF